MAKLLALSIVVIPLLIARQAATLSSPRRGLRLTVALSLAFGAFWIFCLHYLYFRLG